jgi:endonuclease YncB( thermonuclease family)
LQGFKLQQVGSVLDGNRGSSLDGNQQIDAPEKKQPFGQRSKQSLSDLVFAKTVTVETNKRDKYKRSVGKVLMDGVDANLVQVQRGFAWHYKAYEREQPAIDRKVYAPDAENEARAVRRGLWAEVEPMPPWKCWPKEK